MTNEEANLRDKVICLNQFFKPEKKDYSTKEGYGDCLNCTYDENNKYCKRNKPIKIKTFYVNPKE